MSYPWQCPGCGTYYGPAVQKCECSKHTSSGYMLVNWDMCEHVWRKPDSTTAGWTCQKCGQWTPEVSTGL